MAFARLPLHRHPARPARRRRAARVLPAPAPVDAGVRRRRRRRAVAVGAAVDGHAGDRLVPRVPAMRSAGGDRRHRAARPSTRSPSATAPRPGCTRSSCSRSSSGWPPWPGRSNDRGSAGWPSSPCVAALLLYTHYWAIYLVIAVVGGLLLAGGSRRRAARRVAVAVAAGVVLWLPWVPTFRFQAAHTATPWAAAASASAALQVFTGSVGAPTLLVGLYGLAMAGAFVAAFTLRVPRRHQPITPTGLAAVAAGTAAVGVLGAIVSSSAVSNRYFAVAIPLVVITAGVGLWRMAGRHLWLALLAFGRRRRRSWPSSTCARPARPRPPRWPSCAARGPTRRPRHLLPGPAGAGHPPAAAADRTGRSSSRCSRPARRRRASTGSTTRTGRWRPIPRPPPRPRWRQPATTPSGSSSARRTRRPRRRAAASSTP